MMAHGKTESRLTCAGQAAHLGADYSVLTDQQKSRKLSNLLQKMKKNGIIDVRGIAINSEWYLLTKD